VDLQLPLYRHLVQGFGITTNVQLGYINTERLTLKGATGNVGIGTTTPGAKFSLNGTMLLSGAGIIYASSSTSTTVIPFMTWDTSNYRVGIGTTSPLATFTLVGDEFRQGNGTTGFLVVGNPTAAPMAAGTINAQAVYDDGVQIAAPDYVFDDPSYEHLTFAEVTTFVKKHAHLPWTTGRAELKEKKVSLGQRVNQILESVENMWLYIQQLFEHDKVQDQRIDKLEEEIQQLKLQWVGK
jgi:hypothetical protein